MDPNLFHLDWERVGEALTTIIVLSFLLERALSIVFQHRLYINKLDKKGFKEIIAFIVSFVICWKWQFDAVSMILLSDTSTHMGEFVTAAVISGGSKGSIKLFVDIMGWKSSALKAKEEEEKRDKEEKEKQVK